MLNNKIITALLLSLVSLSSYSQVYKWVDEDGKVHYSDKKPANNAVEMNVGHEVMPSPKIIGDAKPIYYDGKYSARRVVMSQPVYFPGQTTGQNDKFSHFYFGGDCTTPTSINWEQLEEQYPAIIPKNNRYYKQISNAFYDNGYQLSIAEPQQIQRQLDLKKAHKLVAHVVDLKLDACVKNMRHDQHSQNLDDFNATAYKDAQNWIKVEWKLYAHDTKELIFSATTEGASNTIREKRSAIPMALRESLSNATSHLLARRDFVSLLQPPLPQENQSRATATPPAQKNGNAVKNVDDHFNNKYKQRAKFVEIITIANYLRIAATEHYAVEGEWATHLSDINLKLSELYSEDQVRSIRLRRDGTIELDVSPSFGSKTTIWLTPSDRNRRVTVSWQCQTNVEIGNKIGSCEAF